MNVGATIAERFRIERLAGSGGMGSIYQAVDLDSGARVGIKLLHRSSDEMHTARLWREARTLASLSHPGIIHYFAHGFTHAGQPYLAMEWLEGEDLGRRLSRAPLSVAETLQMGIQVGRALAAAHERGVIHRDIKPANLFLVGGDLARVKVLDFGLARDIEPKAIFTRTAESVGTPGFMAPEQARGEAALDERVDIYSLGAVLFACLTQRSPFVGDHVMAVLAKLMFDEVPRVSDVRAEVPLSLDELIADMLARRSADRPGDMAEIVGELTAMLEEPSARTRRRFVAVSNGEQRFLSVLLIVHVPEDSGQLTALAEEYDARLEKLADGTVMAVFSGGREPTETATRAARCALAIRAVMPEVPIVLASGRGVVDGRVPVGQVIDRAVTLLISDAAEAAQARRPGARAGIVIDDVTGGLLTRRFTIDELDAKKSVLLGENPRAFAVRSLLGRPTECVGRERELCALDAMLEECMVERSPRVVLVTGRAGAGKSRVGHELLRRIEAKEDAPLVWTARGDSLRSGAPLGLLAEAIRDAMGVVDSQSLDERHRRILGRVERCVPRADVKRVAEFLGELIGSPFAGEGRVQLSAAREDARLMHDQMLRAWEDWLGAETAVHPALIVLEDLHWGDLPTIRFIDTALRNLADRPIIVLALARSEVHELIQDIWSGRQVEEIRLRPLTDHAAMQLARHVLGRVASEDELERLVQRAQGNAYYLEELIRQVAAGNADELPETVLAMVQSRLAALPPGARRVLRAASIFGGSFWTGGIVALVGDAAASVPAILDDLVEREFIVKRRQSRFAGQSEYEFRHDLTREAAYGSLTEDDRVRGHRSAGEWLADAGESEPIVLAEHYRLGGELARSVEWYRCAAEDSLEANDIDAVIERAERATACGADGDTLGALRLLQAEAHNWASAPEEALIAGREALCHLPTGSSAWAHAITQTAWAASSVGQFDEVSRMADEIVANAGYAPPPLYLAAMARCAVNLAAGGRYERARALERAIDELLSSVDMTPVVAATIAHMRGWLTMVSNRLDESCEYMLQAVDYWNEAGNDRHACLDGANVGSLLAALGAYDQAEATLRTVIRASQRIGLESMMSLNRGILAMTLARSGKLDEAERCILMALSSKQVPRTLGVNHIYFAQILLMREQPEEALEECELGMTLLSEFPSYRAMALGVLAQVMLACGRTGEAMTAARTGMHVMDDLGALEEGSSLVRLVYAEALSATGDHEGARAAIANARDHLLDEAGKLRDPARRASFLEGVAEHRHILELARRWG